MANLFRINDFKKLHHWSHIIWDIDGTITEPNGKVSQEVAAKIINLANAGIYQSFITGRDAQWIIKNIIDEMKTFPFFNSVRTKLFFFAEVGCIQISMKEETPKMIFAKEINTHVIYNDNNIRNKLRSLVWDPEKLDKNTKKTKQGWDIIYDADKKGYTYDPLNRKKFPIPQFSQYIWSTSKVAFATFEKIRDEDGKWEDFDTAQHANMIKNIIKDWKYAGKIDVEPISTAINIVPRINGKNLGKSWAATKAIENIANEITDDYSTVFKRTVAFGDGAADLDFSEATPPPKKKKEKGKDTVYVIFVGGANDLPKKTQDPERFKLKKNIIIEATGLGDLGFDVQNKLVHLNEAKGGRVVSEILDFLKHWEYFHEFSF